MIWLVIGLLSLSFVATFVVADTFFPKGPRT